MGAGASIDSKDVPFHKLRTLLVIRAYNSRPSNTTVMDQLEPHSCVDKQGNAYLTTSAIKLALRLDETPQILGTLHRFLGDNMGMIALETFVDFLATGKPPSKHSEGARTRGVGPDEHGKEPPSVPR
ncbi:unnamed protein product, partial [Chrysoparadoxa australica]